MISRFALLFPLRQAQKLRNRIADLQRAGAKPAPGQAGEEEEEEEVEPTPLPPLNGHAHTAAAPDDSASNKPPPGPAMRVTTVERRSVSGSRAETLSDVGSVGHSVATSSVLSDDDPPAPAVATANVSDAHTTLQVTFEPVCTAAAAADCGAAAWIVWEGSCSEGTLTHHHSTQQPVPAHSTIGDLKGALEEATHEPIAAVSISGVQARQDATPLRAFGLSSTASVGVTFVTPIGSDDSYAGPDALTIALPARGAPSKPVARAPPAPPAPPAVLRAARGGVASGGGGRTVLPPHPRSAASLAAAPPGRAAPRRASTKPVFSHMSIVKQKKPGRGSRRASAPPKAVPQQQQRGSSTAGAGAGEGAGASQAPKSPAPKSAAAGGGAAALASQPQQPVVVQVRLELDGDELRGRTVGDVKAFVAEQLGLKDARPILRVAHSGKPLGDDAQSLQAAGLASRSTLEVEVPASAAPKADQRFLSYGEQQRYERTGEGHKVVILELDDDIVQTVTTAQIWAALQVRRWWWAVRGWV